MESFYIDKQGKNSEDDFEDNKNAFANWSGSDCSDEHVELKEIENLPELPDNFLEETKLKKANNLDFTLNDTYLITNYTKSINKELLSPNINKILNKSEITPGFEKQYTIPSIKKQRILKMERKRLKDRTKGKKWFDIPATEVTEHIKNDLQVLKMRAVLDRKHVYKKNDITSLPKYFQFGTVVEGPADFYNGRIAKSQRKKTIVDELLADAECKVYQKKKYKEIMDVNRKRKQFKNKQEKNIKKNKSRKR